MKISIRYNNVHVKDVDLGENFSNMKGDVTIDKLGKVTVLTKSKKPFDTDLSLLPILILHEIDEILKKSKNTSFTELEERLKIIFNQWVNRRDV